MANATNQLKSRLAVRTYFDDDATAATARYIAWVPMAERFMAICTFGVGTGVLTFKIFAATDASATNATEVIAHAGPTVADAANDQLVLECSAEDVKNALRAAGVSTDGKTIHVSVEMGNDNNSDENCITYVREGLRSTYADLTADIIA